MAKLWFSYSLPGNNLDCDEPINSPYTISWHVGRYLRDLAAQHGYEFQFVSLDDMSTQSFSPDDIAIGHTWWDGGFMHQALDANIKTKIILQPYSAGMVSPNDWGMVLTLFNKADHLFMITGQHWYDTMINSPLVSLYDRVTRLDMAINTDKHPFSKTRWNKKGERALCVIGHDTPTKGYRHAAQLVMTAGFHLGHIGSPQVETFIHVPQMTLHGGMLFAPDTIAKLCNWYDGIIALPDADANPTVLLEAAAWGLEVYCSKEAGYLPDRPFRELRKDDLAFNVKQIRAFQQEDEYDLIKHTRELRYIVERDYTFGKMYRTIGEKVSEYL